MTSNKVFDALLVLQYRAGDKKALGLLVQRHHKKFCSHAYWYTHDYEASKDIVQDSWGTILKKLDNLRDPNRFSSWALRIVIRKSLDFLNKNKDNREKSKQYHQSRDESIYIVEENPDLERLKKAIKDLPIDQQIVLRLFYTQEYPLREISDILDISEGTVKSRLFHAREKLKTILKSGL